MELHTFFSSHIVNIYDILQFNKRAMLEKYIPPLILSLRPNVNKTLQTQQGNKMCILKVEHAWVCRILSTEVVNQHELCWTQSDIEFFFYKWFLYTHCSVNK